MGALTSNRKRGDGSTFHRNTFSSLRFPDRDCQAHTPVTKKLKFTYMHQSQNQIDAWKSTFSRFSKYPEVVTTLRREVHAPCRIRKFGISAGSCRNWKFGTAEIREKEDFKGTMGNFLCRYNCAKSGAMNSLQFYPKDKDIIDVDAEPVIHLDAGTAIQEGSEDSSIEEVEAVEHRREGLSAVLDQASPESNGTRAFPAPEAKSVSMETVSVESNHFQQSPAPMIPDSINGNGIVEVENAKKMMDLLCISREESVARHEKLRMILQRRDCKLDNLTFQIALQEKRWALLQLLRPAKKRDEKVPEEAFVPLTQEEEAEVSRAFSANRRRVLVAHATSNIEITGEILQCLRPGAWLNDEVINVYLELLKEREKREPKKYLKCHFFNTFFYKKLTSGRGGYDYKSVRRWTSQRKLGYNLTECDKIFIPIHKEVHWCLAVINQKDEKFQYLDSLGGRDMHVLKVLARYFVDEVKEKTGKEIDVSSWEQEFVEDLPEQQNGWDCGMFMIKYADFYSRGFGLCFNQEHMLYFRQRTVKEILRLKAD